MQIRNLGGSGLRVSAVGLGCNNFGQRTDLETSRKVIHKAIDLGITLFDTADIYAGHGRLRDRARRRARRPPQGHRAGDQIFQADERQTAPSRAPRAATSCPAVEASLKRLKTDYIDLYQQHDYDPLTPIEETMRALDDLVRQGKVRYIGNSNFPAWRIAEAELVARQMNVNRFVSCQDEYSLVVRDIEKDLLPAAQEYKLGLLPFFPLASGLLTGKYKRGAAAPDDTRFAKAPRAARALRHAAQRRHRRKAAGLRRQERPHHAGARLLLARLAPASLQRHRRRHPRRAGRAERESDQLGS